MVDWDGEGYEQISDLQRWLAGRALATMRLRGDERVLDVGCGDGYVSRLLAAELPNGSVTGVDASPRMIEVARSRPAPAGARLRFEERNVLDLQFSGEFDLVVSFNALHWVVDQQAALARLAAAVKTDGSVVVQVVCAGPRRSVEQVALRVCAAERWRAASPSSPFADFPVPFVHVDPQTYPELAASAGLSVTELNVDDLEWDFGSREAFSRWCTVGFADFTARLAPADVPLWVAEVVDGYEAVAGRPGLFRFLQLHAVLRPARAALTS